MKRTRALFILLSTFLISGVAQERDAQLTLAGTVVDSKTGEAIPRAQVMLMGMANVDSQSAAAGKSSEFKPVSKTVLCDSIGAFRFTGLTPGNYSVHATKPGYTPANRFDRSSVLLKASVEDYRVTLSRLGVITGKVVDQEGNPVRGAGIIAMTEQITDGMRQTRSARTVQTNDLGMFRLWNLAPGKYYLKAAGKTGGTVLYAGETSPRFIADESFVPVYLGGGKSLDGAQAIVIEPGSEAQADFSVTLQASYKISGTLGNFTPRHTVKFELLSDEDDVASSRVSVNGDTGSFEIQDVMPGAYTLRATQGTARAETRVTVTGGDLRGVAATLAPGMDIPVRTQVTNPPAAGHSEELGGRPDGGLRPGVIGRGTIGFACNVTLSSPGRHVGERKMARAAQKNGEQINDGELVLADVLPGMYRISFQCYGGYPRSATFNNQDLLANPLLTIGPGAVAPIEILGTRGGGNVVGTVAVDSGADNARMGTILVPQFSPSTGPVISQGNRMYWSNLAPGSYVAYAFSNMDNVEYRDPVFLQGLSGGTVVQVEDKGNATFEIKKVNQ
jgi:uncharacterized protein (DUF2141 family)